MKYNERKRAVGALVNMAEDSATNAGPSGSGEYIRHFACLMRDAIDEFDLERDKDIRRELKRALKDRVDDSELTWAELEDEDVLSFDMRVMG